MLNHVNKSTKDGPVGTHFLDDDSFLPKELDKSIHTLTKILNESSNVEFRVKDANVSKNYDATVSPHNQTTKIPISEKPKTDVDLIMNGLRLRFPEMFSGMINPIISHGDQYKLQKYVDEGSKFAKRIQRTQNLLGKSSKIFSVGSNISLSQSITNLGMAFMMASFLVVMTGEMRDFYVAASEEIIKLSIPSLLDQYARICLYYTRYRYSKDGDIFATMCISRYKYDSFFYFMRGDFYYIAKRFQQAQTDFERALSTNPQNSEYRFQKAMAAKMAGRQCPLAQRIRYFEEFLANAEKGYWRIVQGYQCLTDIYNEAKDNKKEEQYSLLSDKSKQDELYIFFLDNYFVSKTVRAYYRTIFGHSCLLITFLNY